MSEAWQLDDRPEPDELELVYADLKLAQAEIERLKQLLRDVRDKIIMVDPEEATQEQQHESIAIVKRVREALRSAGGGRE